MGSCSSEEWDDLFFDTREEITSVSDSGSECTDKFEFDGNCSPGDSNEVLGSFRYEVWMKTPASVNERRHQFFKWMGISLGGRSESGYLAGDEFSESDRIRESSGAVLRNSDGEDNFSSSQSSSLSSWSSVTRKLLEGGVQEENIVSRIKNLDDGTEFVVDELGQDGMLSRLPEVGLNGLVSVEEFQTSLGLSPLAQQLMQGDNAGGSNLIEVTKRARTGWLRRLGIAACVVDRQGGEGDKPTSHDDPDLIARTRIQRVKVRQCRKRSKELSALYVGQDIQAHEGSILAMKFSLDGQYLASAGEDGIVRVWQVIESERTNEFTPHVDPSCLYFVLNTSLELAPLFGNKDKLGKFKSLRKTSDSACIILPPKVFMLSEKPLHEFHGHTEEVLDLSWSKNKYLLSSSVDKTVRLWKVGCDHCIRVFCHNNYVTCVQFNPMDDNYFVSGSIDGKVRIWTIPDCLVVGWTDIKEIVSAVCYRPNGEGGVIGSMTGTCYFYDALDNHLQLGNHICLQGKKKSPGKRITGFQFSPSDSSKLMVTSADSHVRIVDGVDVVCKYRGLRNAGSQIAASFTCDGKHIVSASEDSNVYIWNHNTHVGSTPSQAKTTWSCERFFSNNASVAIPWCGMTPGNSVFSTTSGTHPFHQVSATPQGGRPVCRWQHIDLDKNSNETMQPPSEFSSLSHGLFSESLPKGSATWPEEKLPTSRSLTISSTICKSHYKFLKSSCLSTLTSPHAWGLVIVTAGWDGRIRSFLNYGLPVCL